MMVKFNYDDPIDLSAEGEKMAEEKKMRDKYPSKYTKTLTQFVRENDKVGHVRAMVGKLKEAIARGEVVTPKHMGDAYLAKLVRYYRFRLRAAEKKRKKKKSKNEFFAD